MVGSVVWENLMKRTSIVHGCTTRDNPTYKLLCIWSDICISKIVCVATNLWKYQRICEWEMWRKAIIQNLWYLSWLYSPGETLVVVRCTLALASASRGGDTSMAGMAIAIPGVLNISKTGDTMGKIRWHRGKKQEKMAKKLIKWAKETGVSTLAIPAKVGQCCPWIF